jgi:hypothetical protein
MNDMHWRSRPLLRLSGRAPAKAPERKSDEITQAAILRRFFLVLAKLESSLRKPFGAGGRRS